MQRNSDDISIGVRDLGRFLLRGAVLALVLAALAGVGVYQFSLRGDPAFRAEATVLAVRSSGALSQVGLSSVTAPPIDATAYQAAGESDAVLEEALEALGVPSPTESDIRSLRGAVAIQVETGGRDSMLLIVEADGETRELASDRANAVASALVAWDARRARDSLDRAITALDEQITALGEQVRSLQALEEEAAQTQIDGLIRLRAEQQQQLAYARALVASAEGLLSVLQPAGTTPRQVAPRAALNAIVAAMVAIVLAYGLMLLRVLLSPRLRSAADVTHLTGLPILAQFPKERRNEAKLREASSYLRTNLLSTTSDAHPIVIMVTSAHAGEGKSLVASHLAESLLRNGHRTLLVDCDLRSPSMADRYPIPDYRSRNVSTTEWLRDPSGSKAVVRTAIGGDLFLDLIPQYGVFEGASDLLSKGLRPALDVWRDRYDAIVFDTAPVRAVADALAIAPYCTATVLVVDVRKTTPDSLVSAADQLERVTTGTVGVVVNRSESGSSAPSYGYGYGAKAPQLR